MVNRMKTAVLKRTYFKDATLGHLFLEDQDDPLWYSIERPWLDNKKNESCIPEGEYIVKPYSSEKYPDVWEVCDVEGRTYILIHVANWAHDVKGCIGVGLSSGYIHHEGEPKKAVLSSGHAMTQMKKTLGYPSEFKLIVRS